MNEERERERENLSVFFFFGEKPGFNNETTISYCLVVVVVSSNR